MTTPPYDSSATEPVPPAPPQTYAAVPPEPASPPSPFAEPEPGTVPAPEPVVARPVRARGGSSRLLNLALGAAVVVAAAGVAFAAGRATAPAATIGTSGTSGTTTLPGGLGGGVTLPEDGELPRGSFAPGDDSGRGPMGGFGGGLTIEGTVDAVTGDSLTVKLASGETITVGLSDDTTYHLQAEADASDVTAGSTVQLRLTGGFRPDGGNSGSSTLGTASDVTIVP